MSDREPPLASDDQRERDRELIAALDEHRPIGEQYRRTGEVPVVDHREPTMRPDPAAGIVRDPTPVATFSRRRSRWRWIGGFAALLLAMVVAYGLVSFWQVRSTGRSDEARSVDAIVVLGAAQYDGRPSPQLAARLDHVVELWSQELAPAVVVTGGNQPGDRFTEAEASSAYLVERGVPESAILEEGSGTTTFESLENVAGLLGDDEVSVLLVTDPYHALRSRLTAQEVGLDEAYVSPTPTSIVTGATEFRRELAEAAGVAVGRIIGFERLSNLTD
jgi:uncharacterized SAM-binding protein YcdF (DUF218 family)